MKYCGKAWTDDCLKRRKSAAVCLLLCIMACLLAGCGDKTEPVVTELGVDGYVYVAELLSADDTGRDIIIKGTGDYLCYPQLVGTIQLSGGRRHVKKYIWSC